MWIGPFAYGGPSCKTKGSPSLFFSRHAMIDVLFGPLRQALRLVLAAGSPRMEKSVFGQIHRLLVIVSHRVLRFLSSVRVPSAESRLGQCGSREATAAFAQVFRV